MRFIRKLTVIATLLMCVTAISLAATLNLRVINRNDSFTVVRQKLKFNFQLIDSFAATNIVGAWATFPAITDVDFDGNVATNAEAMYGTNNFLLFTLNDLSIMATGTVSLGGGRTPAGLPTPAIQTFGDFTGPGGGAEATGTDSIAIGRTTTASGMDSIALGVNASATHDNAVVIVAGAVGFTASITDDSFVVYAGDGGILLQARDIDIVADTGDLKLQASSGVMEFTATNILLNAGSKRIQVIGDIIPNQGVSEPSNLHDIGKPDNMWSNIYANSMVATNVFGTNVFAQNLFATNGFFQLLQAQTARVDNLWIANSTDANLSGRTLFIGNATLGASESDVTLDGVGSIMRGSVANTGASIDAAGNTAVAVIGIFNDVSFINSAGATARGVFGQSAVEFGNLARGASIFGYDGSAASSTWHNSGSGSMILVGNESATPVTNEVFAHAAILLAGPDDHGAFVGSGAHASFTAGGATNLHRHAIVLGDDMISHGVGSITALGAIWTDGGLFPVSSNTLDVGMTNLPWRNVYAGAMVLGDVGFTNLYVVTTNDPPGPAGPFFSTNLLVVGGNIVPGHNQASLGTAESPWEALFIQNGSLYMGTNHISVVSNTIMLRAISTNGNVTTNLLVNEQTLMTHINTMSTNTFSFGHVTPTNQVYWITKLGASNDIFEIDSDLLSGSLTFDFITRVDGALQTNYTTRITGIVAGVIRTNHIEAVGVDRDIWIGVRPTTQSGYVTNWIVNIRAIR